MKKTLRFFFALFLLALLAACSPSVSPSVSTLAPGQSPLTRLDRDSLGNYSSIFEIQFSGATNWIYQLRTRKSSALREENLLIQGIDKAKNPGDIRMVTDGTDTWMIGPGTDNECVRFPNNQGMDPTFIFPETLISVNDLAQSLSLVGEEQIGGKTALHYSGGGLSVGGWQDARVDVWQEKNSPALLRYAIQATGEDVFFGTGTGTLKARYEVDNFNEPTIEPVAGCEIDTPLPETAALLVRLPGMASFETTAGMNEIAAFYQQALPPQGWAENEALAQSETSTVLSYARGAEILEIHVESTAAGGSKVTLLSIQDQ